MQMCRSPRPSGWREAVRSLLWKPTSEDERRVPGTCDRVTVLGPHAYESSQRRQAWPAVSVDPAESSGGTPRQGILLAAAMFVFVIDTSFMNVSISAVVRDLDTTVSGVQSAVAIEALVSAAFILISSKIGDLFGRKRAFVVGMLFYSVGAGSMIFAQGLAAIIVFWAVVGGLGASLYLPAMQSLIHGNFVGKERAKVFALVGAAGAIAAAIGPLRRLRHDRLLVAGRVSRRVPDHPRRSGGCE